MTIVWGRLLCLIGIHAVEDTFTDVDRDGFLRVSGICQRCLDKKTIRTTKVNIEAGDSK